MRYHNHGVNRTALAVRPIGKAIEKLRRFAIAVWLAATVWLQQARKHHDVSNQRALGLDKQFDSYQTNEEMSDKEIRALSKAFKALSNPNRLQLFFNLLRETELNVEAGEGHDCFFGLDRNLNIGAPTVSHHVKELVNADLIETERRGKQLVCTVNTAMVERLRKAFG